jgi:hypothetical protein
MRAVWETVAGVVAVLLPLVVLTIVMLVNRGIVGLLLPLLVLGVVGLLLEIARGVDDGT